ncbi:manganese-dependent inorganic pyrophosphatase [Halorubrum vacuolatum]|uniref:inorganic diphosphatase n=1 Tax=Halorubrum vacuolatum TaxID=63740 RepID=A0A238XBQ6_HALVU|nr:manganese-dependent inorganic pyrophosphatase [Halorubrum vacuolatum]SNR55973.1 manganese-dependent inorganic pyrophosphatase [Halorubrum vacuolatum]
MTNPPYVIGHQQPDTDTICSAVAYARLKQAQGADAIAARAGDPNPETQFVLDRWNVEPPVYLDDASGERLILVDHNEHGQAVDGSREAEVIEVIDHHRIGDIRTGEPILFINRPVGSTATVITDLYDDADVEIPRDVAGLLLSGLLSDTLVLRSPTTTETDRVVAERLAELARVDYEEYGKALLERKGALGEREPSEIVLGDFKEFEFGSAHVGIGQVETVTPETVLDQQTEIIEAMEAIRTERGYTDLLLLVTDILEEGSTLLIRGEHSDSIAEALSTRVTDHVGPLPGVVSRKKQVVPNLSSAFD